MTPLKRKMKPPRRLVRKVKRKPGQFEIVTRRLGRWTKLSPTAGKEDRVRAYVDRHGRAIFNLSEALRSEREDLRCGAEIFSFHRLSPDPRDLGYWGVPAEISERYRKFLGITQLYEWQTDCLERLEKFPGFNIYTVPTSAGKSLVAEILILQRLLYEGKRALFIAPFVSICAEKVAAFRRAWGPGVVVGEIHGGNADYFSADVDVAVCTVEKAHGILNRWLVETKTEMSNQFRSPPVGTIVIDEFHHLLTDGSRGHLIEGLLVKLKLLNRKLHDDNFRVVGLSATMPEINRLGRWLGAEIYSGNFRPVQLKISTHLDKYKYLIPLNATAEVGPPGSPAPPSPSATAVRAEVPTDSSDFLVHACSEIAGSVLIFCVSKLWCERSAFALARKLPASTHPARADLVEALARTSGGCSEELRTSILAGVAYHHAGLTTEQRGLIETAYRERHVRVVCCTSTLAAGVNLGGSTQRVIIRSFEVLTAGGGPPGGPGFVDAGSLMQQRERLLQMAGRAGRTGSTEPGECFVCVSNRNQVSRLRNLLEPEAPAGDEAGNPESELGSLVKADKRHYSKLLLECVGTGLLRREEELVNELQPALLSQIRTADQEIKQLQEQRFLRIVEGELLLTPLGEAVGFSLMTMTEAEETQNELKLKLKNLKLDNDDFELLYLCVPLNIGFMPDLDERKLLPEIERQNLSRSYSLAANKKRWLCAFALRLLLTNTSIARVAEGVGVPVASMQQLLNTAASTCGTLGIFCERRKWHSLAAALASLAPRLQFAVPVEMLPLLKLPSVFAARARALHAAGLTDLDILAKADVRDVAAAISRITAVENADFQKYDLSIKNTAARIVREAKHFIALR